MPVVGQALVVEGTTNRTYSWNGNGSDFASCTTTTLLSSTATHFNGLTNVDPAGSSAAGLFTQGTAGAAVAVGPDGFPGAWDGAINDPRVAGAIYVNNMSVAPSTPAGTDPGQDGNVNVWRLFTHAFTLPAGAVVSSSALHLAADNSVGAFLDNVFVGTAPAYNAVSDFALAASAGAHQLQFVVKNDAYDGATNPTGVIYRADINYCVPAVPPQTECPAAPSVAANLLKLHNVKPKTTSPNYIADVAHKMGPQTLFNGVNACNTAAYRTAVDTFLHSTEHAY